MFQKIGKLIKKILICIYVYFRNIYYYKTYKLYKKSDEDDKFTHILEAINYIKVAGSSGAILPPIFFEFGCYSGRTFSAAVNTAKFLKMNNFQFYAFDSFLGLPSTDDQNIFKKGQFKFSKNNFKKIIKNKTGLSLDDQYIIEGFYEKSLTSEAALNLPNPGVIHVDCDLYSSTVSVLKFLKPILVNSSVILFDDYYCYPTSENLGQKKAIEEFLNDNKNFEFIKWKSYSTFGQSFYFNNKSKKLITEPL